MSNSSIWPIDRTLLDATTPGESRLESDSNKGVFHIPQSLRARASPSNSLVSYPWHVLGEWSYLSAEMQSVYSIAPADWAGWLDFMAY